MNSLHTCETCGHVPELMDESCGRGPNCPHEWTPGKLVWPASDVQLIKDGSMCPYCKGPTALKETVYGYQYACDPCGAYVGCHKGTRKALGRLANSTLRALKKEAHAWFDPVWQGGKMDRTKAYEWLCCAMLLNGKDCHIGMFDEEQCARAIAIIKITFYKL